jgi:Holliday junction resolvasome RuvABC ATP-dependent DNA helicase subunit
MKRKRQLEMLGQQKLKFDLPKEEVRRAYVDPDSPTSPFRKWVGNRNALGRLRRAAYSALNWSDHNCAKYNFALIGPPQTGKTTLVKLFAEVMQLPLAEIQPQTVKSVNDVLVEIAEACEKAGVELIDVDGKFTIPPCIVFIDEVHALKDSIVQGLLKATEPSDRRMETEEGWEADTSNVCWIIATTDRGLLFDAFDTRFSKVVLKPYTRDEIAQILQLKHSELSLEDLRYVAKFVNVPREADAFVQDVLLEMNMTPGRTFQETVNIIAEEHEIDEFGMTKQRLEILKALADGPVSKDRVCIVARCKQEELIKFIMPPLLYSTSDQDSLVTVTSRGYALTKAGCDELAKRGIDAKEAA